MVQGYRHIVNARKVAPSKENGQHFRHLSKPLGAPIDGCRVHSVHPYQAQQHLPMATPHPKRPDIRPLGKTASRLFITFLLVLAVTIAVGSMYLVVDMANDPATQARVDRIQRMEDSVRAAQSTPPPAPSPAPGYRAPADTTAPASN